MMDEYYKPQTELPIPSPPGLYDTLATPLAVPDPPPLLSPTPNSPVPRGVDNLKPEFEDLSWFRKWLTTWFPCPICTHALSPRLMPLVKFPYSSQPFDTVQGTKDSFHISHCTNCETLLCPACLIPCEATTTLSHCRLSRPLYLYKALVELDRSSIAERNYDAERNHERFRNNSTRKSRWQAIRSRSSPKPGSGVGFGDDMADYGAFNARTNNIPALNQSDKKEARRDRELLLLFRQIACALRNSTLEPCLLELIQNSSVGQTLEGLLRNDSISDCSERAELYTALLDVLESMAANPNLTIFCTSQRARQGRENVNSMEQLYQPFSTPPSDMGMGIYAGYYPPRVTFGRGNSNKSMGTYPAYCPPFHVSTEASPAVSHRVVRKPVAGFSKANQTEMSPSLLTIMGNLAKQAQTFLKTGDRLTGDLDGTVVLSKRIIRVRDALRMTTTGQEMHGTGSNVEKSVLNSAESYRLACFELVYDEAPSAQIPFHYSSMASTAIASNPKRTLTLGKELSTMATCLPPGIFVRNLPNRIKALIAGPEGTPYYGGLFEFDIFAPSDYPAVAPQVQLTTTAGGQVRFNPNLYAYPLLNCCCIDSRNGMVCLSLIGTWPGSPEEQWQPYKSTIMQILISIQSMLLCPRPYFNEPGIGVAADSAVSIQYNKEVRLQTVKVAICDWMNNLNLTSLWKVFCSQVIAINCRM